MGWQTAKNKIEVASEDGASWTAVAAARLVIIPMPQSLEEALSDIARLDASSGEIAAMIPSLANDQNRQHQNE